MATTPNLGLHQWQPGDSFLRTDFNSDLSKLDTAVGGQLKIVTGSFTANATNNRSISLGFRPKLLLLFGTNRVSGGGISSIGAVFDDVCYADAGAFNYLNADGSMVTLTDSGFMLKSADYFNYQAGNQTYYVAFR